MDVRMPEVDEGEATRRICAVLILTMFDLDVYVYGALRAGASGFLLKDTPPDTLLTAIRTVAAGDGLLAPSVTRRVIAEFARTHVPKPPFTPLLDRLTDRERQTLDPVARGLSNAEIADRFRVTVPPSRPTSATC